MTMSKRYIKIQCDALSIPRLKIVKLGDFSVYTARPAHLSLPHEPQRDHDLIHHDARRRSPRLQTSKLPFVMLEDENECEMLVDEIASNIDARKSRPDIEADIEHDMNVTDF